MYFIYLQKSQFCQKCHDTLALSRRYEMFNKLGQKQLFKKKKKKKIPTDLPYFCSARYANITISFFWPYNCAQLFQARRQPAGDATHPLKSAKRSTFSHKIGQKWVFVTGLRGRGSKRPLFGVQKVHFLGVLQCRTCTPQSILATGLIYCFSTPFYRCTDLFLCKFLSIFHSLFDLSLISKWHQCLSSLFIAFSPCNDM